MDEPRVLKRFPRNEGCSECRAKKWYVENGFRYCQNGHRVQSWVEFDATEEDVRGLGQVTRRKKSDAERYGPRRRLVGAAARTLFLECLQIILRRQVAWLIQEEKHPAELESVVKDLWDLRVRGCPREEDDDDKRDVKFHSSQDDLSAPDENGDFTGKEESWDPSTGSKWPIPSVVETLVLCYFACLLLRVPTTLGDIRNWANGGRMPYKKAVLRPPPSTALSRFTHTDTLDLVSRPPQSRPLQAAHYGIPVPDGPGADRAGFGRAALEST